MFSFFIARRYLFARKRHHTTGVITVISVCGVALATAALVVTLSVFNGFKDMVASFFTAFDPQLKVQPMAGKTLMADDPALARLKALDCIDVYTEVLEDQALIVGNERQWVVTVKGVSDNFVELADINSILYGDGEFILHADVLEYGVMGIRLASALGLGNVWVGSFDPAKIKADFPETEGYEIVALFPVGVPDAGAGPKHEERVPMEQFASEI